MGQLGYNGGKKTEASQAVLLCRGLAVFGNSGKQQVG